MSLLRRPLSRLARLGRRPLGENACRTRLGPALADHAGPHLPPLIGDRVSAAPPLASCARFVAARSTRSNWANVGAWTLGVILVSLVDSRTAGARAPADGPALAPGSIALERLASGVHVVVGRDDSLPVAAVSLAIERGTRDDPAHLPGLYHAFAYHLQMGNRSLRPGAALARAHDAGGLSTMAVGSGQFRFAALVPQPAAFDAIWVESQRLRVPTTNAHAWLESLAHARNDSGAGRDAPLPLIAAVWRDAALGHFGHGVSEELAALPIGVVAQHLARNIEYAQSTLVVVAPGDGRELLEHARNSFTDLPPSAPAAIAPTLEQLEQKQSSATRSEPKVITFPGVPRQMLAWPVSATAHDRLWARVICHVLDRKARGRGAFDVRARCKFHDDPHRPTLFIQVRSSTDALTRLLAQASAAHPTAAAPEPSSPPPNAGQNLARRALLVRLDTIAAGSEALAVRSAIRATQRWSVNARITPLELATRLASHPVELRLRSAGPATQIVDLREFLAETTLDAGPSYIGQALDQLRPHQRIVSVLAPESKQAGSRTADQPRTGSSRRGRTKRPSKTNPTPNSSHEPDPSPAPRGEPK